MTAGMALRVGRGWRPTFGRAFQGAQTPRAVPGFRCECSEPLVLDSQQLLKKAGRPGMGGYLLRQSAPWWSRVKTLPIPRLGPASANTRAHTHARTHADRMPRGHTRGFVWNGLPSGTPAQKGRDRDYTCPVSLCG